MSSRGTGVPIRRNFERSTSCGFVGGGRSAAAAASSPYVAENAPAVTTPLAAVHVLGETLHF